MYVDTFVQELPRLSPPISHDGPFVAVSFVAVYRGRTSSFVLLTPVTNLIVFCCIQLL